VPLSVFVVVLLNKKKCPKKVASQAWIPNIVRDNEPTRRIAGSDAVLNIQTGKIFFLRYHGHISAEEVNIAGKEISFSVVK
jgi:hypothetical protein